MLVVDSWGRVTDKGSEVSTLHHHHNRHIFFAAAGVKIATFFLENAGGTLCKQIDLEISDRKLFWSDLEQRGPTFKPLNAQLSKYVISGSQKFLSRNTVNTTEMSSEARKSWGSICWKMEIFGEWDGVGW